MRGMVSKHEPVSTNHKKIMMDFFITAAVPAKEGKEKRPS
jgi:hypothetical protein